MKTIDDIKALIHNNRDRITREFFVKEIGLFGSYVTSKQTESSDIDILVEFESGSKTFDNYMNLKFYLEDLLQATVDLVIKQSVRKELKDRIISGAIYVI